jgi:hypothetical protein
VEVDAVDVQLFLAIAGDQGRFGAGEVGVLIGYQRTLDPTMLVRVMTGLAGSWRSRQRKPGGRLLLLVILRRCLASAPHAVRRLERYRHRRGSAPSVCG